MKMNLLKWKTKLVYKRDELFAKGTIALIGALACISAVFVVILSIVVWLLRITTEASFSSQLWEYSMIVLNGDPTGGAPWAYRLTTQIIVYVGIFFTSVLIGIFANSIKAKIEELRKGRSFVIEKNHILILGWSDDVLTVISELIEANESEKKSCIVILADKDKVEMEDHISSSILDRGNTKIVCRSGNAIDIEDLQIVSPQTSKSIIILANGGKVSDIKVIKTILALTNDPRRRRQSYHIIAQLYDSQYIDLVNNIGKDEVCIIHTCGVISKIAVQACRQPGLASVYKDLLDYAGDEIYAIEEPNLVGETFGKAMLAYKTSSLIGLLRDKVLLNPSIDEMVIKGDKVIVIASDDSNIKLAENIAEIDKSAFGDFSINKEVPENILMLGWNRNADYIIRELNEFAVCGSSLTIASDEADVLTRENNKIELNCLNVKYKSCDIADRDSLESLDFSKINRVIVLSCNDHYSREESDALTLVTLIMVRNIKDVNGYNFTIVGEILDTISKDLLVNTKVSDFLVSEQFIALLMAQIAEQKEFADIFYEIFQADGSEIYFKSACNYVKHNKDVNFYTIVKSAQRYNEVAIGYRYTAQRHDPQLNYGINLNPDKSDNIRLAEDDMIIVLAEN
jgi:hypothetical protein